MRHAIRLGFCVALLAAPPISAADGVWPVDGKVEGKNGKKAEDVSGLACGTATGFPRECLIIDDEAQGAQWVSLEQDRLVAGATIGLISDRFGDKPLELDGEAVAFDAGAYYVAGSHGAPRRDDGLSDAEWAARVQAGSHVFRIVAGEAPEDSVALRALLLADPVVAPFVDAPLEPDAANVAGGLTIEGLAVVGDRAFFGLRGPVVDGCAVIFEAAVAALFDGGAESGRAHLLDLGAGRGVRDLAPLGDDLLVLAGPLGDAGADYSVFRWSPYGGGDAELVADLTSPGEAKAEGILVLEADPLRVLGLFDGPDEGAPHDISMTWQAAPAPVPQPECEAP